MRLRPKPEDSSYTFEALSEVAANLAAGHEQFRAYLAEAGFIQMGT